MAVSTEPGSNPDILKDAHYHPIKATESWKQFVAAMTPLVTDTELARAREDRRKARATTYARGTLGGH